MFDKVVGPNGLLSNKTRVLVTHKVSILSQTDEIIVIKDGTIAERGSFEGLIKKKGEFAEFIAEHLAEQTEVNEDLSELESLSESLRNLIHERSISRTKSETITSDNSKKFSKEKEQSDNLNEKNKKDGKLIEVEGEETGSVKLSIYSKYVKAMGIGTFIIILIGFIVSNAFQVANTLWLEQWSADAYDPIKVNDTKLRDQRLYVYGILGVGETFFNLVSTLGLSLACVSAAKILHNKMLNSIIRSPMSFFGMICYFL